MPKPTKGEKGGKNGDRSTVITLEDFDPKGARPEIAVTAWDPKGKNLHTADVADDGSFIFPERILEKAYVVRVGPKDDVEPDRMAEIALNFRPEQFKEVLEVGVINVGRRIWEDWFIALRCVTGRVRVCRRSTWWYRDLVRFAALPVIEERRALTPSISARARTELRSDTPQALKTADLAAERISPAASLDHLIAWPFRCAPVCRGTVEVYRRTCCCDPWIVYDPRLEDLLRELEDIVRVLPLPDPPPEPLPPPFRPAPDPAPFSDSVLFKSGTLDEKAARAASDLQALRRLPAEQVPAYINARPYLLCPSYSCGAPVRVAEGQLGPDGRFNICWRDFPRVLPKRCHDEYAYIVKQSFGAFTLTIYDGVAAGHWHDDDDDPTLTSYHPLAYGCRHNPPGAFVFLDLIGDTGAHELITPDADGAASVATPSYNSGLVFPAPSPAAAVGANLNRNWGGTLKLSYMFSEGMQDVGAKYYRISVVEADANGDPTGTYYYLDAGLSWNKSVSDGLGGVDIVPVSLGPTSAGTGSDTQNFLYEIPYDTNPITDWNDGQYHAYLNTNDPRWNDPEKRHLVMLEVFDADGRRLRPNGTPATGLGGQEATAAFTYRRRYQETGATAEVPYGALTHMFWWDNRPVSADIVDLRRNGLVFNAECLFFGGAPDTTFGVGYRAYHPNVIFQRFHRVTWRRGLASTPGSSGTLQPTISTNVGMPPSPAGASATNTFAEMLRTDLDPTRTKCAFTAFLNIWGKRTDGDDLGNPHDGDTAAFLLEIDA